MKFGNIPVECIASMDPKVNIRPLRIRFEDRDGLHVVKIDKVQEHNAAHEISSMWHGKTTVHKYKCTTQIDGIEHQFELKFDSSTCRWFLI